MGDMEAAVNSLEEKFKKAEANIDSLQSKINEKSHSHSDKTKMSSTEILEKLASVKREFAEITSEAASIQQEQLEVMDYFRNELSQTIQALSKIPVTDESSNVVKSDNMKKLESFIGPLDEDDSHESKDSGSKSDKGKTSVMETHLTAEVLESGDNMLSPFQRRAHSSEFLEVSDNEFSSVSSLIRGRLRLEDVNKVYKQLWTHFVFKGNSESLSPQVMNSMGMRVTGHSGEAKLKVLRSLKLVHINSKGFVSVSKQ